MKTAREWRWGSAPSRNAAKRSSNSGKSTVPFRSTSASLNRCLQWILWNPHVSARAVNASSPSPGEGARISLRRFVFFHRIGDQPLEWRTQLLSTLRTLTRDETGSFASCPLTPPTAGYFIAGPERTGMESSPITFIHSPSSCTARCVLNSPTRLPPFSLEFTPSWASVQPQNPRWYVQTSSAGTFVMWCSVCMPHGVALLARARAIWTRRLRLRRMGGVTWGMYSVSPVDSSSGVKHLEISRNSLNGPWSSTDSPLASASLYFAIAFSTIVSTKPNRTDSPAPLRDLFPSAPSAR
mmetsp:Transcript_29783/g.72584  ORF Transcript_29783/g.72584 Transcript_29783/m.72584 type:complete len:296 (+) Transcript_29783:839-1726(+)